MPRAGKLSGRDEAGEAGAAQGCDLFQAGSSCLPPTCSLDGWGLAAGARGALEVTAACPQGTFGWWTTRTRAASEQREGGWLQERERNPRNKMLLAQRVNLRQFPTFRRFKIDLGQDQKEALFNFTFFLLHFVLWRLSFVLWNLLVGPHAGTAAISVTRSSCAPAREEESSSPGTGLLSKKNLPELSSKNTWTFKALQAMITALLVLQRSTKRSII